MTAHDWFIERRTEYAARVLEPAEMALFAEHLLRCPECPAAVQQIEDELAWLPMAAAPAAPRPGLQRAILDHALGRSPRGLRRWSLPIGLAASLISGVIGWQLGQRSVTVAPAQIATAPSVLPTQITTAPSVPGSTTPALPVSQVANQELAALQDTLSIMKQAAKVMQAKIMMHGKEGGMVIFADAKTHRWNVVVHGLPAPTNGRYQFWFICADGMVRGAEVNVDPTKPMIFTTGMPVPARGAVLGAALTFEPMDESSGPPRGKTLAHIML